MHYLSSREELLNLSFMDGDPDLEKRVEDLLGRLTLDEKIKLSAGRWGACSVPAIKRLGIKSFKMTDGPHGVGGVGLIGTRFRKNTYFPVPICRAATWNPDSVQEYGKAVAEEVRSHGFHMNLAPGINIIRSPLGGRNFEYFSEDPYHNKVMAVAQVKGVQSQRIAACVKHFVCNNQDTNRFRVNAIVSERALQEIYLPAFEAAVREANAWSIMACYNKVNGFHGCENKDLLRKRLMKEWGFHGFVVSDWFATKNPTNTEGCLDAGLTLEMPIPIKYRRRRIKRAIKEGFVSEETFNDNVKRLLRVMFLVGMFDDGSKLPQGCRNTPEHQALAREIAEEGIVLLKNEHHLLPLDITTLKTIAVLGPDANKKHSFGGGSSCVRALYEITPLQGLKDKCRGKAEIIKDPAVADVAIIFAGLRHKLHQDSECSDRRSLALPKKQVELINKTVNRNPRTVIVLINGGPVTMEWLENVPAVVEAWYPGMEGGHAIGNVLFGDANPSGKLPVTFPKELSHSPAHVSKRTFPGRENVYYDEGIFVGYRHFDAQGIEPLFPFGFGLSYTTFDITNLQVSKKQMRAGEVVTVSVDVQNTGKVTGAEVVQLYIQDVKASIERPPKELKGFSKIKLAPHETKTVTFKIGERGLSFYDERDRCWQVEKGAFNVLIGNSSRDIMVQEEIEFVG